jgi:hypothetical protein
LPADDDPIGVTFLDSTRRFNPAQYAQVDVKAVVHYMWDVLKIPRRAAEFNLEPYVQLSSSIAGAVEVWLALNNPAAKDAPPLSYHSPMTQPQADIGPLFLEPQQITFKCGPFPLEDEVTGAVCWEIPPPDEQAAVTQIEFCTSWMSAYDREQFEIQCSARQHAFGIFNFCKSRHS